jgi:formylglycine-generating enzyme required for sulfatase activity
VGSFSKGNSWVDAYDLAGNVWEWVADWYAEDYYARSPKENPRGPQNGEYRVLRGGSWYGEGGLVHSASRVMSEPSYTGGYLGFRCVVVNPLEVSKGQKFEFNESKDEE